MAWNWRKRKSILPGVRLNFGKKGISTTIGPRGASMTFGPNGTYFNTSIPGTGLYNRKKIGESSNTTMDNSNIGCGRILLWVLATFMWILVISVVLLSFNVSVWLGVIFCIIIVLAHVIVALVAQNKSEETKEQTTTSTEPYSNVSTISTITDDYFSQMAKVADEIYSDYERILKIKDIDNLVSTMGVTFIMNGKPMTNVRDKVRLLFWVDITKCYLGLGHLIDFSTKEGIGLFYFIARTNGCIKQSSYTGFGALAPIYKADAETILKGIKAYVDNAPTLSEVFLVSRLLSGVDSELHRKFLVDIYRFASLTAKADNTVTDDEAEWLSNIMKLQGKGDQEIVSEEDDDEPVSSHYTPVFSGRLDPLFADVARWVVEQQDGSISRLQRKFEIGYNRAGKLSDQLEAAGVVGPNKGPKGRDVLIQDMKQLEDLLSLLNISYIPTTVDDNSTSTTSATTTKKKTGTSSPTKQLDSLIGLESVKKEVETLSNFIKIQQTREAKGLKTSAVSYHCVFTGNPGTGKTTVARILAKIYKNLGVVTKGHLVETDRAGLVAEYVGQTAVKTNKIIDSALDGVLFIDEAYSLISKSENDYGKEAIATLLKRMEDNRDRLIVILAGYTKEMKEFIDSNPGLQSRFNRYIEFPDYSADELLQIFEKNMAQFDYHFGNRTRDTLLQYFKDQVANKDANFGNGRLVRNVFEKTLERQANRLSREINLTTDKLSQIEIEDLPLK